MATTTFNTGDDVITGTPGATSTNNSNFTITANTALPSYTFNPFGTGVGVTDNNADGVTLRLVFSDNGAGGDTDGATLWYQAGGTGTLVSMTQGQTFNWTGSAADTATWLNTMVVIGTAYNDSFRVRLTGTESPGGSGAYSFTYLLACYMQGTMIATPEGERAVEALRAGDLVRVLDGSARAVKWVGHRTYEAEFGASEAFVRPVVIRAGALGAGLPTRDLRVSPQHGMLIDGAMVPAAALVNGVSILRDETPGDVTYFHVELEGHAAIYAEGAASETFVDHASRAMFDNADEYNLMYGSQTADVQEIARLEEGAALAAIRTRLAGIAGIATATVAAGELRANLERIEDGVLQGWIVDSAAIDGLTAEVLIDGAVAGQVVANRYRADLDQAGINGGRGGFTFAVPAATSLAQVALRLADGRVVAAPVVEMVGA
jgi:hypothetical protein